jgi:hypothetical protein
MTRLIPDIFGLTLASSRCVSWTHNTSHLCDLQSEARSSPLATEKPSIFCVITFIAVGGGGGGPKKGLFDFECLGILAPVLVRLVRDIYPGMRLYVAMQGTLRAGSYHTPHRLVVGIIL